MNGLIWDRQKDEELISVLRNSPSRRQGCMQIASKYGISYRAVEGRLRRFLRSNPSLDKELPKGQASTSVSGAAELLKDSEKLRELFRCIQEYGKEKGMKAFA